MTYVIEYARRAKEDLQRLDAATAKRIVLKLRTWCKTGSPLRFAKPLSGVLSGYFRFRVGDYRVIFRVSQKGAVRVLLILKIGHRKNLYLVSGLVLLLLGQFLLARPIQAFNPNYLLSDAELNDVFSLDFNGIQRILEQGFLGTYKTADHAGQTRYASDIVWRASQTYKLNPKFLLVLLQKEQSLVEDPTPSEHQLNWATGYGVCDVCLTSDPEVRRWEGFGKQVNSAAAQMREGYMADLETVGVTSAGFQVGKKTTVDGVSVTPFNPTTAALYSYTPHLEGNENFVKIWSKYFGTAYPSGTLLQAQGEEGVWLIQNGLRRAITSYAALVSRFQPEQIIGVDPTVLSAYQEGTPIAFPNYSLLRSPGGTVYLLVDDARRGIDSSETFRQIGFSPDEILDVSWEDLSWYTEGESITTESVFPQGRLLQDSSTGGVYFVQDGVKYPLKTRDILDLAFTDWTIFPTSPIELETYQMGDSVKLPEGLLVKTEDDSGVYMISEGTLRPIASETVFEEMRWKWENIKIVEEKTLKLHHEGAPISL